MGRTIRVNMANDKPSRQRPEGVTTVFVGNLSYDTVEDTVIKTFEQFGGIKQARMAYD